MPERLDISRGPYGPDAIKAAGPAALDMLERWHKIHVGRWAAFSLFGSLLLFVLTACIMALANRSGDAIMDLSQALQPLLLPGIGAIVGFAVGERVGESASREDSST